MKITWTEFDMLGEFLNFERNEYIDDFPAIAEDLETNEFHIGASDINILLDKVRDNKKGIIQFYDLGKDVNIKDIYIAKYPLYVSLTDLHSYLFKHNAGISDLVFKMAENSTVGIEEIRQLEKKFIIEVTE